MRAVIAESLGLEIHYEKSQKPIGSSRPSARIAADVLTERSLFRARPTDCTDRRQPRDWGAERLGESPFVGQIGENEKAARKARNAAVHELNRSRWR